MKVQLVVKPQMEELAATSAPTTFGELMETLCTVPGNWQVLQGTSWPGSSRVSLGSGELQSNYWIASLPPDAGHDSSPKMDLHPVETFSYYPSLLAPKPINI